MGGRKAVRTTLGYTTAVTRGSVLINAVTNGKHGQKRPTGKHESLTPEDLRRRHADRERQAPPRRRWEGEGNRPILEKVTLCMGESPQLMASAMGCFPMHKRERRTHLEDMAEGEKEDHR